MILTFLAIVSIGCLPKMERTLVKLNYKVAGLCAGILFYVSAFYLAKIIGGPL